MQRGLLIKITAIDDGYNIATVIATEAKEHSYPGGPKLDMVRIARPYAYANTHHDSKTPMVGTEVLDISYDTMVGPQSMYHVYESERGELRILDT